jgi:hypothetical protein
VTTGFQRGYENFITSFFASYTGNLFNDRYAVDLRGYQTIANGHIFAYQGIGVSTDGGVPFNELPTPLICGLYKNVFVERHRITFNTAYRFPIKNRWSGPVFLAAGDVFHNLKDYDINDMKYGGGIRWAIGQKEKINPRFDIGVSLTAYFPMSCFRSRFR